MSRVVDTIVYVDESFGDRCKSEIGIYEIIKAMKGLEKGKAAGYERVCREMLRTGKCWQFPGYIFSKNVGRRARCYMILV